MTAGETERAILEEASKRCTQSNCPRIFSASLRVNEVKRNNKMIEQEPFLPNVDRTYSGKIILRTARINDLKLDGKGWYLILVEDRGWRAVKKNGTCTFYHDDYFDCIPEAIMIQKRYC